MTSVRAFMEHNFRHFNAREALAAARAYEEHLDAGGAMLLALGGAMSTAELGVSLARMIREKKLHAVCSTGANLEEDLYRLVAQPEYLQLPGYRDLTPADEAGLADRNLYRVTDTCIPLAPMVTIDEAITPLWVQAAQRGESRFPWEYCYQLVRSGALEPHYAIDPSESWVVAAAEMDIPIYTPGWEDSTVGNAFTARVVDGTLPDYSAVKSGLAQMGHLIDWYLAHCDGQGVGFFQIGGGIAGDFSICVAPLILEDLEREGTPGWSYFCQIGDSTTSYGSYSGAVPNEKITWRKLSPETPRFMIESDATIVAPLIFGYVLGD